MLLENPFQSFVEIQFDQLIVFLAILYSLFGVVLLNFLLFRYHAFLSTKLRWFIVSSILLISFLLPLLPPYLCDPFPVFVYPFILGCVAWVFSLRSFILHFSLDFPSSTDPSVSSSSSSFFSSLLVWCLDHFTTPLRRYAGSAGRWHSLKRLVGALLKTALFVCLYSLFLHHGQTIRELLPFPLLLRLLDFLLLWSAVSGFANLNWGVLGLLTGFEFPPFFRMPVFSTSPTQFWNDRWNRYVHLLLRDSTFRPFVLLGVPKPPAALLVFLHSGIAHEYILYCAFQELSGYHFLYFFLQSVLCSFEVILKQHAGISSMLDKTPLVFRWICNLALMLTVSKYFFHPFVIHCGFLSS